MEKTRVVICSCGRPHHFSQPEWDGKADKEVRQRSLCACGIYTYCNWRFKPPVRWDFLEVD